jgi:DNA-binding CsgD family transcriptional regulator
MDNDYKEQRPEASSATGSRPLNDAHQGHGVRDLRQGGWHTGSRTADELAAREREVAELIVEGLTNQEIADQLQIACGTAGQYVKSIIAKLGARNRTHAAVLLVRCVCWPEEKAAV